MDDAVGYRERSAHRVPAVMWRRDCEAGQSLVLPDGCMDVITDGERVWVAGPDTRPHLHRTVTRQTLTAIRFAPGIAPIVLGVPGAEFRDSRPDMNDLGDPDLNRWGAEIVGSASPAAALEAWAGERFLRAGGAPGGWTSSCASCDVVRPSPAPPTHSVSRPVRCIAAASAISGTARRRCSASCG